MSMLNLSDSGFEQRLLDSTRSDVQRAHDAARHLIGSGGKRVRPRLAMLVARAAGLAEETAQQIGTAAELVHSATLLHDDVIDRCDTRRGHPTVSAKYGIGSAILTGDFLLAQALLSLTDAELYPATRELSRAVRELAEAEILQLQEAFDPASPLSATRRIADGKTGALFAWCARAVVVTARDDATQESPAFRNADQLGRMIGYAFQVADDLLDFLPETDAGKPVAKDLREGQVTIPMQLARQEDPALDAAIHEAFKTRSEDAFDRCYILLRQGKAEEAGRVEVATALASARDCLARLTTDPAIQRDFADYLSACTLRTQ